MHASISSRGHAMHAVEQVVVISFSGPVWVRLVECMPELPIPEATRGVYREPWVNRAGSPKSSVY